ncbi:MAG: CBS domain-containing protein [Chloroflexi bacterium]|nr:CBS domain-containing protein [Chloroflexota bacterium]
MMLLSRLLGRPVLSASGDRIGRVHDVVARIDESTPPLVVGLVVRTVGRRELFVPAAEVAQLGEEGVRLTTSRIDIRPFARRPGELLLRRDLLDKKVIDLSRGRVARANDLVLTATEGQWQVSAVDVSGVALLDRIGLGRWARGERRFVPWDQIDIFASQIPVGQPGVRHRKLAQLHPGDIAQIVDEVAAPQAREILSALDDVRAADAVEDLEPQRAASLVGGVEPEVAAEIVEEMGDDAAADLLGDLPPEQAEAILERLDPEDAAAVRTLLSYPDDTAGGLMTTEVVVFSPETTVGDALARLRAAEWVPDPLLAVVLVDSEDRPQGLVPLRELVLADPTTTLAAVATPPPATCRPEEPAEEAVRRLSRYNLLALPVVDESGALLGVVTIDDALDFVLEQSRRRSGLFG